jgi:hypothetical protein
MSDKKPRYYVCIDSAPEADRDATSAIVFDDVREMHVNHQDDEEEEDEGDE